jgi:predicted ribosome quality control (RQC) complex YloA/Tae2 family protein
MEIDMPPKGYRSITVREDIIKRLDEIVSQKGFSSLNDAIVFLLDRYNEFTVIYSKLTDLLSKTEDLKCLGEELFARLERFRVKIGLANVFEVIKFLLDTYEAEEEYLRFRKEALERLEKIDRTIREIDEKIRRSNEWWYKYHAEKEKKRKEAERTEEIEEEMSDE